jgi:hypothetical protein
MKSAIRKEKLQNECAIFFARNNGANSSKNGKRHKKWNVKKSKSLKGTRGAEKLPFFIW